MSWLEDKCITVTGGCWIPARQKGNSDLRQRLALEKDFGNNNFEAIPGVDSDTPMWEYMVMLTLDKAMELRI